MGRNNGQLGVVSGLVRSAFLVDAVYAESAREHGLTSQQGQLLCVLMVQPYCMGELGSVLGLAKSSLTGLVDRTERNGLVRRSPSPHDARTVMVSLTPHGSEVADTFYTETCRRVDELPKGLSAAERRTLADLLGRIVLANDVPTVFAEGEAPKS